MSFDEIYRLRHLVQTVCCLWTPRIGINDHTLVPNMQVSLLVSGRYCYNNQTHVPGSMFHAILRKVAVGCLPLLRNISIYSHLCTTLLT
jgi:hypothetical protein